MQTLLSSKWVYVLFGQIPAWWTQYKNRAEKRQVNSQTFQIKKEACL